MHASCVAIFASRTSSSGVNRTSIPPVLSAAAMDSSRRHCRRAAPLFYLRHRLPRPCRGDEKPVTASPLDSALTNSDACNPFRFRSYKNCRVSHASSSFFFFRLSLPGCTQLFVAPFFSYSYELQISQVLCFDIHTNCRGCITLSPTPRSVLPRKTPLCKLSVLFLVPEGRRLRARKWLHTS